MAETDEIYELGLAWYKTQTSSSEPSLTSPGICRGTCSTVSNTRPKPNPI